MDKDDLVLARRRPFALLAAAVALTAGCAHAPAAPKPLTARCNDTPQWATKDDAGRDVGIFVCFGEENRLLYVARLLPPAPPVPAAAPKAKAAKK